MVELLDFYYFVSWVGFGDDYGLQGEEEEGEELE